ncbi:hypothetical protein OWM54_42925 [Myxococcus sp. MISCRS1]|uniref:hypothetical protein n=1 Tax=Myxococcus sp. MISCRS1 TaxID=2996786 RepID=UPI00226F4727|nr:hypothetical protein [Myxococcus sp. MISCRS1]MCY1003919.1 hypothetical protein [Myxococcus sp. MISCRS1]
MSPDGWLDLDGDWPAAIASVSLYVVDGRPTKACVEYADEDGVPYEWTKQLAGRLAALGVRIEQWEDTTWEGRPGDLPQETARLIPLREEDDTGSAG